MHFVEHNVSKQRESLVIMLPIISLYVQLRLAYLFKWMNIFKVLCYSNIFWNQKLFVVVECSKLTENWQ